MSSIKSIRSIVPLFDRVLVQRIKAQAQTSSGIYIPEANVEKLNEANVIAVGSGLTDKSGNKIPVSVKEGDKVLIPAFGGTRLDVKGEDYILFRDAEILAKIN
ncbi:chaperonin Cpn10 [Nadsonia fulvescens var. elongata DSM 6958]|uniref:Chaperonin Cpn10 n=1 Tax=Nadsonia fulvescens var. elongata DSM 6958 TaxID=857566 RepID=A0A1E3PSF6_9ASCO|nr:chaperonin Cpn10 [Nadsonia fulvescens var. elongata DSM 6958]